MPTRLPGAPLVTLSPCRASPVPAVSFLARYSGRTVEAYRHDLRGFFQWATDDGVVVMEASSAHIELFRAWMEDRGLAASTIEPGIRPADPSLGVVPGRDGAEAPPAGRAQAPASEPMSTERPAC